MAKKIILFGGSFNPVHLGHTEIAKFAYESIQADELYFVPAKRSPFKDRDPEVTDRDRIEMIKLAISDMPDFCIEKCELERPAPSYTVDTLEFFKLKTGEHVELYWLIGADMAGDLWKWYEIDRIFELCRLCVVNRGGVEKPDFESVESQLGSVKRQEIEQNMIETPFIDISSTEIRKRIRENRDISTLVDEKVAEYIYKNGLYQCE